MSVPRIVTHDDYLLHDMGPGHPERPDRLRAISRRIAEDGLLEKFAHVPPVPLDPALLELNHEEHLLARIRALGKAGGGQIDGDTSMNDRSYDVALLSAGGVVTLPRDVFKDGAAPGFALVRPPGHHAEPARAMGFCIFNNVAIAAEDLLKNHGAKRVVIIDPDIHHGNGTQASFYGRSDVLYVSSHQYPYYPGTGHYTESGKGEGEGYTINIPLPAGQGDAEFLYLYQTIVSPIVREFAPDAILISAGFDAHQRDPLGGMKLSSAGYAALAREFLDLAAACCGGRIVFALEGGYDLQGLSEAVSLTLQEMIAAGDPLEAGAPRQAIVDYAAELRKYFGTWWKGLRA